MTVHGQEPITKPQTRASGARTEPPALGVLRDGFESDQVIWRREDSDATVSVQKHERTKQVAHEGSASERFQFTAGPGSGFYYSYALPKIPITSVLRVNLFVRANRPGAQLLARVILPKDIDPETGQPSYVLIPGTLYDQPERWQRLEVLDLPLKVERQTRVLRAKTKRPVKIEGAYLDRLVINLYSGAGATDLAIDELSVAPVPRNVLQQGNAARNPAANIAANTNTNTPATRNPKPPTGSPPLPSVAPGGSPSGDKPALSMNPNTNTNASGLRELIKLEGGRLSRWDETIQQYVDWIFLGVEAPGADIDELQRTGLDVLVVPYQTPEPILREATRRGFLLMPIHDPMYNPAVPPEQIVADFRAFPVPESVFTWYLGDNLGAMPDAKQRKLQLDRIRLIIGGLRKVARDEQRRNGPASRPFPTLTNGTIGGLLPEYLQNLNGLSLAGIPLSAWGSMQHPSETYDYLVQRPNLTALVNARALFWTIIPAAAPRDVREAIWGVDQPPTWGEPQVQMEQVRLYSYLALMAGYRGLVFQGDALLTSEVGRPRLMELAFLNAEIRLLSAILAAQDAPPPLLDTYPAVPANVRTGAKVAKKESPPHPTIKAAAIPTIDNRGSLVFIADFAPGAQWQPPQMAVRDLTVTVPAPESAQAYLIHLGEVQVLDRERVPGGILVTIPEFDTTAVIMVTTDMGLLQRITESIYRIRPKAILMALEQGRSQLQWVQGVHSQLAAQGRGIGEAMTLFMQSREHLRCATEALEREEYPLAWEEARRVNRPLRVLMRAYFDQAVRDLILMTAPADPQGMRTLISAVSSPPCTAFNTLPQHYVWLQFLAGSRFGANLISDGSFNDPNAIARGGWVDVGYGYDKVPTSISSRILDPARGDRCIRLTAGPADQKALDRLPPFLDQPAVALRSPAVMVRAGQLIRIRVQVWMPRATTPGMGGAIVRDSLGGETLQFRSSAPIPQWKEVVLYRRAALDGPMFVTLGLAGYGEAYFDDLIIERVESESPTILPPAATPSAPVTAKVKDNDKDKGKNTSKTNVAAKPALKDDVQPARGP